MSKRAKTIMDNGSSSSTAAAVATTNDDHHLFVDEFYLSALFDSEDGVLPVSDEKYAYELHLQEALVSAAAIHVTTRRSTHSSAIENRSTLLQCRQPGDPSSSSSSSNVVCLICMDAKEPDRLFSGVCAHKFCTDCMARYLATKLQENIAAAECPEPGCRGTLDPESCRSILPREVHDRWEKALCESLLLGFQKVYCPYKDCSAMLVDDDGAGQTVTSSECPHCRSLFCARCKVPWHSGVDCEEFGVMGRDDLMAVELAEKNDWRRCPRCCFYVDKIDGCKHITCRCKYEFCYGCGSEYTAAGCSC